MIADKLFREHWAVFDGGLLNSDEGRWRANDPASNAIDWMRGRFEADLNGLMLINVTDDPYLMDAVEFYAEAWGGHPGTTNHRFMLNGKGTYGIGHPRIPELDCVYHYPTVAVDPHHLVKGVNALMLSCDRGNAFMGNFIIDEACFRAYLVADHPDITAAGLSGFRATVTVDGDPDGLDDSIRLRLVVPDGYGDLIEEVHYQAEYAGYDDNSAGFRAWRGYTRERKTAGCVGSSSSHPYGAVWDASMVPDQAEGMSVRALVRFKGGLSCFTEPVHNLRFRKGRDRVMLHAPHDIPHPFWVRDKEVGSCTLVLPDSLDGLDRALLYFKAWDGGAGTVQDPVTLNGHPYRVTSGGAPHEPVYTVAEVDPAHLRPGSNTLTVTSDTEHHGIEVLHPGPALVTRWRSR